MLHKYTGYPLSNPYNVENPYWHVVNSILYYYFTLSEETHLKTIYHKACWAAFIIAILGIITVAQASLKSDPNQLVQFEKTGQCPSCNLSSASIYMTFAGAANLQKANLTKAYLHGGNATQLQHSNFSNMMATDASLTFGDYTGTNFTGSLLLNADLSYSTFSDCDFTGANVTGADLSNSNLSDAKITADQLKSAKSICNAILPDGSIGSCK